VAESVTQPSPQYQRAAEEHRVAGRDEARVGARRVETRSPDRDINPHVDDSLLAQASRHPTRQVPLQY
jgi:hypothetical protein